MTRVGATTVPNAYVSVALNSVTYVYLVNDTQNPTSAVTGVTVECTCVIRNIGCYNRALKFIFEDDNGVKFSKIIDGLSMWWPMDVAQEGFMLPPVETIGGQGTVELFGSLSDNSNMFFNIGCYVAHPFALNYSGWENALTAGSVGLEADMITLCNFDMTEVDENAALWQRITPLIGESSSALVDYYFIAGLTYNSAKVEFIPPSLMPIPATVGIAKTLLNKPTSVADISFFDTPITTIDEGSGNVLRANIPIVYGQDFSFYVAMATESNLASNAVLDMSHIYLPSVNDGIYFAGVSGDALTAGNIKVWRFNVPCIPETSVQYTTAPLPLLLNINPQNVPFVTTTEKVKSSSTLPIITFTELTNPLAFTWLQPNPDGLKSPITAVNLGGLVAIDTGDNRTSADIVFRSTVNASYVVTSVQITQTTLTPLSLTAPTKTAILSDFIISGSGFGTVMPTTSAMVDRTCNTLAFPALSEIPIHIEFAPTLKVLNTITMTNPANLAVASLTAINTRKIKLQFMGYLNGGSTPVALGSPIIITGTAL